jgi:hypothetical protein
LGRDFGWAKAFCLDMKIRERGKKDVKKKDFENLGLGVVLYF